MLFNQLKTELEKEYFNYLTAADFAIFIVYALLFYVLLGILMRYWSIKSKQAYFLVSLFFIAYHGMVLLDFKLDFLPYLPDSSLYYFIFDKGIKPESMPPSLNGLFAIIPLLRIFLFKNILAYISLQITLYFISVFIIIKSWELIYTTKQRNSFLQFCLIFCLILPASVLFSVVPLREAFSTFAFASALYFLTLLFQKARSINLGFLMSLILIFYTRMQVVFYFILSLVGVKTALDKNVSRKVVVGIIGLILFLALIFTSNYQISPEKLEYARNYRVATYNSTYGEVQWSSYTDIVMSAPQLMLQFLLAPIPILHSYNPLDMRLALIDACIVLCFMLALIFNLPRLIKEQTYWLILIGIYLFLFGIYEFSLGGAVRHRLPLILMIAMVAAESMARLYSKKAAQA